MFSTRHTDGRLRVSGGFTGVALALLVLFALSGAAFAEETPSTTSRVLPFANLNGYTSTLVEINPTGDTIDVPRPCPDGQSLCPPIVDRFPAYSVRRTANWPGDGTDFKALTLDSRIVAYVEIETHFGTIAHLQPLELRSATTRFFDLPNPGIFEGYLWIAVPAGQEGTFITVHDEATQTLRSFAMGRGGIVVDVVGPTVRVYLGAAPGWPGLPAPSGIYAFAFTVHDATGAITPHAAQ